MSFCNTWPALRLLPLRFPPYSIIILHLAPKNKKMKRFVFVVLASFPAVAAVAQTGKAPKPAPALLKSEYDSASYAVGMSVASFYKQQGFTKLNGNMVVKGMNDVFGNQKTQLDKAAANSVLTEYMNTLNIAKAKGTIEAGKKLMDENKKRPTVKTTASGLQYEVLTEGTGVSPTAEDSVTCNYVGTFLDGKEFDNSYNRGQPITFPLNQVIAGWTEALQLMKVGAKYRLWIPYTLGYGASDYNNIPGGSTLIFEVELLDVKKKQ